MRGRPGSWCANRGISLRNAPFVGSQCPGDEPVVVALTHPNPEIPMCFDFTPVPAGDPPPPARWWSSFQLPPATQNHRTTMESLDAQHATLPVASFSIDAPSSIPAGSVLAAPCAEALAGPAFVHRPQAWVKAVRRRSEP